jgi:hypothetical protein
MNSWGHGMRIETITKLVVRAISILIISGAVVVLAITVMAIRNGMIWIFVLSSPVFAAFTIVACATILILGPYASLHLWKLREKGRIASLILSVYSSFYLVYSLYCYEENPYYLSLFVWFVLMLTFVAILFILLPPTRRLFNPHRDGSKPWYHEIWRKLTPTERLTITISCLALIVALSNTFFSHVYRPNKLLASVTDICLEDNELSFSVTLINSGAAYEIVTKYGVALSSKKLLAKGFFEESRAWMEHKDNKIVPEGGIILKPGEIKLVHVHVKPDIRENFIATIQAGNDLVVALLTQTIDSNGKTHRKHNVLGTAQLKDNKIVGLRNTRSVYLVASGGKQESWHLGEGKFGIVFNLLGN